MTAHVAEPVSESSALASPMRLAKPLLKWPGGKRKLLGDLVARMPHSFRHYFEPFAGGAALFWRLFGESDTLHRIGCRATIADVNTDLIGCYIAIAMDPDAVSAELDAFRRATNGGLDPSTYYGARAAWNELRGAWSPAKRAATMLYLNKACYNGLWRVNSGGEFNVPIGKFKTLALPSLNALHSASVVLRRADLHCASFQETLEDAGHGDFVYADPPYMNVAAQDTRNQSFTAYSARGFGEASHRMLAACVHAAIARGAMVMLSQADAPLAHELYRDLTIHVVEMPRSINSKAAARGNVRELIITGGF